AQRQARPLPALEWPEEGVTQRGGLRAGIVGRGILFTYLVIHRLRCLASRWSNELQVAGVPSPDVAARDMGTADPAVDVEEFDSVGFAAERAFSGCRQPQPEASEVLAVAERRRRGKCPAVVGFEKPHLSLPES